MPTIIGLNNTTKILNRASVFTDRTGIQTLSQTFTTTADGLPNFVPTYLDPHPDFPTMAVNAFNTEILDGGLARLQITYVGLLGPGAEQYISAPSSQIPSQPTTKTISFPKPNISQPIAQPGTYIHCPFVVNLQFIEAVSQKRTDALLRIFNPQAPTAIPLTWRGLELPQSPVAPYVQGPIAGAINGKDRQFFGFSYYGLQARSISFEKRGFFNIVYVLFMEGFSFR